jgi:hypothetical protein
MVLDGKRATGGTHRHRNQEPQGRIAAPGNPGEYTPPFDPDSVGFAISIAKRLLLQ